MGNSLVSYFLNGLIIIIKLNSMWWQSTEQEKKTQTDLHAATSVKNEQSQNAIDKIPVKHQIIYE